MPLKNFEVFPYKVEWFKSTSPSTVATEPFNSAYSNIINTNAVNNINIFHKEKFEKNNKLTFILVVFPTETCILCFSLLFVSFIKILSGIHSKVSLSLSFVIYFTIQRYLPFFWYKVCKLVPFSKKMYSWFKCWNPISFTVEL